MTCSSVKSASIKAVLIKSLPGNLPRDYHGYAMMRAMPKLIFFDLDGTLAVSKSNLTQEMAGLVAELLERTRVAVVSGGALPQFLEQVVEQLPLDANYLHLYLLPTS